MVASDPIIRVRSLSKSYGSLEAVRGIDFEVRAGEVFGLLGPNGAGKTTTVEILEGLRPRTSGEVFVLGFDPATESTRLKDQIGVCLQSTNLPDKIRVMEAMELFASFHSRNVHIADLLRRLQLWEHRRQFYATLSGGQKQRLVLAMALLNDPQVLFLDEPTAGLDPQARREIHSLISELRTEKRTILLTTHYIEEAEKLCDQVAILDGGLIISSGTPQEIQNRTLGHSVVEIRCETPLPDGDLPHWPDSDAASFNADRTHLSVATSHPARTLVEIVRWIDQHGVDLADVRLKRPSLEDVFLELTGRSLRE